MSEVMRYALFALLGVFVSSVSQVLLKKSAQRKYDSVVREYLNARVIVAYSLFVGATLLSTYAFKVIPLSMGPIIDATGYLFVTLFGYLVFHERQSRQKLVALAIIVAGIAIYSLGL